MKIEYICLVTLDARDISLASANGGTQIEHPVAPVKTIIRVNTQVMASPVVTDNQAISAGWRRSASDPV